ncbi:MAG: hypothetical protein FD177_69 [Desulfovibrionaceae bacterium]|nr:MAG: hypothetical protein FD177_69 [Desulfovibrionaceae bacterium]
MRQFSLFENDFNALAGVLAAIRAAMNTAAGASEEGRKLLVDSLNAVAGNASVRLTAGNTKNLSINKIAFVFNLMYAFLQRRQADERKIMGSFGRVLGNS